ncbi:MAG: type II toxin-antitoxin system VapC family toxin [Pirellulales bacterium]|nr:type II toxin-antitoxin system VapC family toxin [Pirellulales bacterium]
MTYLLDTNAWISYLNSPASSVRDHLAKYSPQDIAICSVVKAELYFGAYNSTRCNANLALLTILFRGIQSYPFDDAAAEIYGRIRAELSKRGTPIGPNDLMISAIALTNRFVLVTHNASEFGKVPELQIEDWQI